VEWLDRKYAILFSFIAMGLSGTLFGLSRAPREIMFFGGLTVFFLAWGSTAIYTYTPELHPTEIRTTGMGIASVWGRGGAVTLLLSFGCFFAVRGKSLLFIISDLVLLIASISIFCLGPPTRGRQLEDTSRGTRVEPCGGN
jgi:putative MFS transporter